MIMRPKLTAGKRVLARLGQVFVAYLTSGVVETIVFSELRGGGHADAPLSRFPEYLVLAPVMPIWTAIGLFQTRSRLDLASTGVFVICFIASWVAYRRALPFEM
jgi:hypothetical protein